MQERSLRLVKRHPVANAHLVDTHCHLDLHPNPNAIVHQAEHNRIYTIAVTNTPSVFPMTAALIEGVRYIRPAIGLHPELAVERQGELDLMWKYLSETRYVGEIGLDYMTQDKRSRAVQREILSKITDRCSTSGDKILTVHSRRAESDVVSAFGSTFPGTVILHWYSGSIKALKQAANYGFYFSINPAMAYSSRFSKVLGCIPPNRLLTETDGPFVKMGTKPAEPKDVEIVIQRVADLWKVSDSEVQEMIYQNFKSLLTTSRTAACNQV